MFCSVRHKSKQQSSKEKLKETILFKYNFHLTPCQCAERYLASFTDLKNDCVIHFINYSK